MPRRKLRYFQVDVLELCHKIVTVRAYNKNQARMLAPFRPKQVLAVEGENTLQGPAVLKVSNSNLINGFLTIKMSDVKEIDGEKEKQEKEMVQVAEDFLRFCPECGQRRIQESKVCTRCGFAWDSLEDPGVSLIRKALSLSDDEILRLIRFYLPIFQNFIKDVAAFSKIDQSYIYRVFCKGMGEGKGKPTERVKQIYKFAIATFKNKAEIMMTVSNTKGKKEVVSQEFQTEG
jgi:hypothetical protein